MSAPTLPSVVAVAYSGGRDSTALLHATWRACHAQVQAGSAAPLVVALHVHHGLSPLADSWLAHCEAECARWASQAGGAPRLRAVRLTTRPDRGDSVEAWARAQRRAALSRLAREEGASLVLLAHHRRDQAETFLLQALRGAGPAGLAAMPAQQQDADGLWWGRPWLDRSRESIEAYVAQHGLRFVEDDSNADARFARNRLRLDVWPAWTQAFPDAEVALAQSVKRMQEARACLAELAQIDLLATAPHGPLQLALWARLSVARRCNALRAWLSRATGLPPTRALLERLCEELGDGQGAPARWLCGGGELQRYRGNLSFAPRVSDQRAASSEVNCVLSHDSVRVEVPAWGGALQVFPVAEGGWPWVPGQVLTLRARQGGERFQAGVGQPARSLKKQFQAASVPAWARAAPLVFQGGALMFVPGLGLDARGLAGHGVAQIGLRWEADR